MGSKRRDLDRPSSSTQIDYTIKYHSKVIFGSSINNVLHSYAPIKSGTKWVVSIVDGILSQRDKVKCSWSSGTYLFLLSLQATTNIKKVLSLVDPSNYGLSRGIGSIDC